MHSIPQVENVCTSSPIDKECELKTVKKTVGLQTFLSVCKKKKTVNYRTYLVNVSCDSHKGNIMSNVSIIKKISNLRISKDINNKLKSYVPLHDIFDGYFRLAGPYLFQQYNIDEHLNLVCSA